MMITYFSQYEKKSVLTLSIAPKTMAVVLYKIVTNEVIFYIFYCLCFIHKIIVFMSRKKINVKEGVLWGYFITFL